MVAYLLWQYEILSVNRYLLLQTDHKNYWELNCFTHELYDNVEGEIVTLMTVMTLQHSPCCSSLVGPAGYLK